MTSVSDIASQTVNEKKQPIIWWYLILSCLYYYSFVFDGYEIIGYAIFYGIPLVYLCLNYRFVGMIVNAFANSWLKYFVLIFLVFALTALLIPLFHVTGDYSFLTGSIGGIFKEGLKVLFLMVVFLKHISPEADWRLFIKYFIWVNICYVSVSIIMLLFPPLKDFWYAMVKDGEHGREVAVDLSYVTRYGWMGFSGFSETFLGTLAIAFQCFLLSEKAERITIRDLIPLFMLLVAVLFYGRIGLLVSLCVVAGFFCLHIFLKKPSLLAVFGIGAFVICLALGAIYLFSDGLREWFTWAFSIFINLFSEGRIGTTSTDILFGDMYFLPPPETMLFGDGRYADGIGYYLNTDAGLMRPLLFGGLPFAFLRYLLVAFLMFAVFSLKGSNQNAPAKLLLIALILLLLLFEIKGEVIETAIPIVVPFATIFVIHHLRNPQGEPHG